MFGVKLLTPINKSGDKLLQHHNLLQVVHYNHGVLYILKGTTPFPLTFDINIPSVLRANCEICLTVSHIYPDIH